MSDVEGLEPLDIDCVAADEGEPEIDDVVVAD